MKIERLEHSRVKAIFDVTVEEFEKALDQAFETENAKVTIKGFRTGKAPRSAFEKKFGVESLYDEALNVVLNNKAKEIYENKELANEIVGKFEPAFEGDTQFERGKEFQVSLTFDVYPTFNLPQYKGIKVAKAVLEATEEEVDNAIKALTRKDASKVVKEEQVIALGDYAVFDFVGSVDGVEFPGGKAENYELQIGSGQFIPGFEDQMVGMKAEEVKDLVVTFPENYGEASLAGKEAVFKVTVHEVKVETFPELTDEYVAGLKIEGVSTLDELKANKKAELEAQKKVSEKDRQVDSIINNILDNAVVDMPASLEEEKIAAIRSQYEQQAKMYNIPFETFLSLMGIDKEKYEEQTATQGKRQALFNVVISKIIEEEKLAPSKEELEAAAAKEAEATNADANKLLQEKVAQYYSNLAYEKVINLLLENAEII